MTDRDEAMAPLERVAERLAEACKPLGLDLQDFIVHTYREANVDGRPTAQAMFLIDRDDIGKTAEHAKVEEEFRQELDAFEADMRAEQDQQRQNDAIEQARRILEGKPKREE